MQLPIFLWSNGTLLTGNTFRAQIVSSKKSDINILRP